MIQRKQTNNSINFTDNPAYADLVLYESTSKKYAFYSQCLQMYTNDILREWCSVFFKYLRGKTIAISGEDGRCKSFIKEYFVRPSNPYKITAINFLSIFWADTRNFVSYLETLPEPERMVWQHAVRNWYIEIREAKKLSGIDFVSTKETYWSLTKYEKQRVATLFFLTKDNAYSYYDSHTPCYLYLPGDLRRQLLPWALNLNLEEPTTFAKLPSSESLTVFNCEKNIFTEINLISGVSRQGGLDLNEKGKLTAAQIKNAGKIVSPLEFFEGNTNINGTSNLRAQQLFTLQALFLHKYPQSNPNPASVKRLFIEFIPACFSFLAPLFLPHITGLKLSEYKYIQFRDTQIEQLLSILKAAKGTPWIPVRELLEHLQYKHGRISHWSRCLKSQLTNKWEKEEITLDVYYTEVIQPFYFGYFFLMGAFGLLDLAYTPLTEESRSPFETLRYIRLTPLGSYVLGNQADYTIQAQSDTRIPYFSLDEHMLIARALQEKNPYEPFLANISTHIGLRRYRVSPSSVLGQCKNLQDVENTIQFFKQYICEEPPQVWKDFFHSLLERSQSIQPIGNNQYTLFKLDKQNEELLKLISTHPDIREYALKAENYLLLVRKDKLNQFVTLLKAHGYLLEKL